jgi:hypothetical protein
VSYGKAAHRLGISNEQAVLTCGEVHRIAPWVIQLRAATPEEDATGKDVIAETEYGDIPLQVKSSKKYVDRHHERYPDVPVVVVFFGDSEKRIRQKVRNALEQTLLARGVDRLELRR